MKAWILREHDYYDSDSTTVGITLDKDLAEFWDTVHMCYTDELEIDDPNIMRDCRITGEYGMGNGGFMKYKRLKSESK